MGSPNFCSARSKIACKAYSPLTEIFISAAINLLEPSRDCNLQNSESRSQNPEWGSRARPVHSEFCPQCYFMARSSFTETVICGGDWDFSLATKSVARLRSLPA